jgi:subtilisin family serine protease
MQQVWDHGIQGRGQVVGIADTGIDYDNCLFRDPAMPQPPRCSGTGHVQTAGCIDSSHRKIVTYRKFDNVDYSDYNYGHGTHVAGSVAGSAEGSSSAHAETRAYNGAAPGAKIAFDDVAGPDGIASISRLWRVLNCG